MGKLHFTATIEIIDINPYVLVNKTRATTLQPGWRKPMPVLVQINGQPVPPWRINMMPIGDGSFYLYLHGEVRKASGTKVGDRVTVDVSFDESYAGGPMPLPAWFRRPLYANSQAKRAWEDLTPSRQKEIVRYFLSLKSDEARARNLQKVLRVLSGDEDRFMARTWKDGK
jgi:hypothetical protein